MTTYTAANQITAKTATGTWGYDAAGNETHNGATGTVSAYGERGQVTAIGAQTMAHLGFGSQRTWQMGTTNFALSPLGTATHNAAGMLVRTLPTPDGAVLGAKTNVGDQYVADQVGSVIGRFDAAGSWKGGASHDPYGQTRFTSGMSVAPWAFTGGFQHSAASYKLGARFYDVSTGRFTQMDPTGQETNPCLYAMGNPCTVTDPPRNTERVLLQCRERTRCHDRSRNRLRDLHRSSHCRRWARVRDRRCRTLLCLRRSGLLPISHVLLLRG